MGHVGGAEREEGHGCGHALFKVEWHCAPAISVWRLLTGAPDSAGAAAYARAVSLAVMA